MVGAVSSWRNVAHAQDTWSVIWIKVMWEGWRVGWKSKDEGLWVYDLNFNVSFDQFVDLASYSSISQTSCPNSSWMCLTTLIRLSNWSPIFSIDTIQVWQKKHFTLWPSVWICMIYAQIKNGMKWHVIHKWNFTCMQKWNKKI